MQSQKIKNAIRVPSCIVENDQLKLSSMTRKKFTYKREAATSTKGHYIKNAVLLEEVKRAKSLGYVTDELMAMIRLIAVNYVRKFYFGGYSYRDDMIAVALQNLHKKALKFDCERFSNPFAYYTTSIHRSFVNVLGEERYHRNLRDLLLVNSGVSASFSFEECNEHNVDDRLREHQFTHYEELEPSMARVQDVMKFPSEGVVYSPNEMVYDETLGYYVKKGA